MEPSVEEAIHRVKAEIIAPDWRLNSKRIELLETAFFRLRNEFRTRKELGAVLTMAGNVLQYVKTKGDTSPPDTIDFLKEAMANVVNLYEDPVFDPAREEQIFQQVFAHFQELKKKIKTLKGVRPTEARVRDRPADSSVESPVPQTEAAEESEGDRHLVTSPPEGSREAEAPERQDLRPYEVRQLMVELRESLQRAEEVGAALRELLHRTEGSALPLAEGKTEAPAENKKAQKGAAPHQHPPSKAAGAQLRQAEHPIENCPPTDLREMVLGEQSLALPAECVALVRPLEASVREAYLREGQVPLKDFGRAFQSLPKQFVGKLATIRGRKLKKLVLPVMFLQGFGLPEIPDGEANTLVVLSYGHWHGVLFCSEVQPESRQMVKFQKAPNGDIIGIGHLEDGAEVPVVNLADLLRREGFLALV